MAFRQVHKAIVTDNNDPQQRGRIRVACSTLSTDGSNYPSWVEPAFPFMYSPDSGEVTGLWLVPYVGATVEIEIESRSTRDQVGGTTSIVAPNAKYRCGQFGTAFSFGGLLSRFGAYPDVKGFETKAGALVFCDTNGEETVSLISAVTKQDGSTYLTMEPDGSFTMATGTGQMLHMDTTHGTVSLIDDHANLLNMNEDGWYITDADGNMVQANGGIVSIFAQDAVLINASGVNAKVSEFRVQTGGLDTFVIKQGSGPVTFTAGLAQALTEIMAIAPSAAGAALVTALQAGTHTSTRMKTE